MERYINEVILPKLSGDGGWVEFVSFDGELLTLVFRGECSKCHILSRCTDWIACEIERDMHKKVRINAVRKKPYFQDK